MAARCRDPPCSPGGGPPSLNLHISGDKALVHMAASFGGASLIPALNASSVPGQLLSLRPPAQLTLLRQERSGMTERAQGYLSRQLSPVDIGSPRPGPSVTQHLPMAP